SVIHPESRCVVIRTKRIRAEDGKPTVTYESDIDRNFICGTDSVILPITIGECEDCDPIQKSSENIKLENGVIRALEPGSIRINLDNGTCISESEIIFPDQTSARELNVEKL